MLPLFGRTAFSVAFPGEAPSYKKLSAPLKISGALGANGVRKKRGRKEGSADRKVRLTASATFLMVE